jgi:hypothetical protein
MEQGMQTLRRDCAGETASEKGGGVKPGIHYGVSMVDYLKIDALSSGVCHALLSQSPRHAKWKKDNPEDANSVMDIGTVAHRILLEGHEDGIVIVDADDWRTKAAREAREAANTQGRIAVLAAKMGAVREMAEAAKNYLAGSELGGILEFGKPEVTMIWDDDGVLCKARPDFLPDDRSVILHVKTTGGSAEPESWIRNQLFASGYDVAAAFYERGLDNILDAEAHEIAQSVFLVIEQSAPYGCSLIGLDPMTRENAERNVARAIATWRQCKATNRWPCYPSRIAYAEVPAWELAATERRDMVDPIQELEGLQI